MRVLSPPDPVFGGFYVDRIQLNGFDKIFYRLSLSPKLSSISSLTIKPKYHYCAQVSELQFTVRWVKFSYRHLVGLYVPLLMSQAALKFSLSICSSHSIVYDVAVPLPSSVTKCVTQTFQYSQRVLYPTVLQKVPYSIVKCTGDRVQHTYKSDDRSHGE